MAYDGIVVAATVSELNQKLLGGSITKVAQPEKDELLLTVKVNREPLKLCISANASVPFVCLKDEGSLSLVNAPGFCMALRKHIGGGRILKVEQAPGLERIVLFTIEHLNEMGDKGIRILIAELMGKHSNIILTDAEGTIIDSIKHVSALTSSLREVLPGRSYFMPETRHSGLGRVMDQELCERAGLDSRVPAAERKPEEAKRLEAEKQKLLDQAANGNFRPNIYYEGEKAVDFSAVSMVTFRGENSRTEYYESISEVVSRFYQQREIQSRVRARSEDMRLVLKNLTERTAKKLDLQEKQLADTADRDKNRICGELLNTYGYGIPEGAKELVCPNYYDENREIRIPLDGQKSPRENANRYFDKYQKQKRTAQALENQIRENQKLLYHLETLRNSLLLCENEADLREIRKEMADCGYIRKAVNSDRKEKIRKEELRSAPLHFISSDGMDIYVGRNNVQNEELDFKMAGPEDWWFHAKKIPGSHVIVKTGKGELPDRTCLEAASLAAFYSKAGREGIQNLIEVDYVQRKELKKVPGAARGFVIYHTNFSVLAKPKEKL